VSDRALVAPRAIIFDWDNTLIDSWACIHAAVNATLRAMGRSEWTSAEAKTRAARSLRDSFPTLFGDRWTEARDIFYAAFAATHLEHLRPMPGAAGMLEYLNARGLALSVVSNKAGEYLRQEVDHLGWAKFFDRIVGATDTVHDKPATAPVHLALGTRRLVPGADIWFVGDAPVDMECALRSGCTPILIRQDPPGDREFDDYPPRHHVPGCDEFVSLVNELLVPISMN
jgi:phosphoglycolate phosphatase